LRAGDDLAEQRNATESAVQSLQRNIGAAEIDVLGFEIDLAAQVGAKKRTFEVGFLKDELTVTNREWRAHPIELEDFARHVGASLNRRPSLVGAADNLADDRVAENLEILDRENSGLFRRS
jgi:hypothetical protein